MAENATVNITIVEDNEIVKDGFELLINSMSNHKVVSTYTTCEKAIKHIKNDNPDVILMDLWMPEVEGDEAVRLLRKNNENFNTPVILFSAYPKLPEVASELQVNYLNKPFDLKELREKNNSF